MSCGRKWRLTLLGWDKPVPCRVCGLLVLVSSWQVTVWTAPFIFFLVVVNLLFGLSVVSPAKWGVGLVAPLAGGLVLVGLAGLIWGVPLSKRGRTDPEAVRKALAKSDGQR